MLDGRRPHGRAWTVIRQALGEGEGQIDFGVYRPGCCAAFAASYTPVGFLFEVAVAINES